MNVLNLIPSWIWAALVAVAAVFAVKFQIDSANARADLAKAQSQSQATLAEMTQKYRAAEAKWGARQEEIQRGAEIKIADAKRSAAAARAAGDGLRARAAAVAQQYEDPAGPATGAAVASSSSATPSAADMLADVLGKLEERTRQLAEIADERGLAGVTCERSYEAVRTR